MLLRELRLDFICLMSVPSPFFLKTYKPTLDTTSMKDRLALARKSKVWL